jgi:hypothetical protein
MKFMIPFLSAMLSVASVAQSPSGRASGVPSVAIPKTTEVPVIQTAKQGVTADQVMAVIPAEIRAYQTRLKPQFLGLTVISQQSQRPAAF